MDQICQLPENAELLADFGLESFEHRAFLNRDLRRTEMHLVSRKHQVVRVAGYDFRFEEGESIHTGNSHKFIIDGFREAAGAAADVLSIATRGGSRNE